MLYPSQGDVKRNWTVKPTDPNRFYLLVTHKPGGIGVTKKRRDGNGHWTYSAARRVQARLLRLGDYHEVLVVESCLQLTEHVNANEQKNKPSDERSLRESRRGVRQGQ